MISLVKKLIFVCGMLVTGTINTISKKMQLDCVAPGYYNYSANGTRTSHTFNKPWFQTLLMFLGEILCLFAFFIVRHRKRRRLQHDVSKEGDETVVTGGIANTPIFSWIFIIPAFLDLLGTTLAGIGLLFIDASIWQMMRGSIIIFAGTLSVVFLKRRLFCFNWTGMLFTVAGLALVGTKSVFSGGTIQHTAAQSAIGVVLVLLGAFVSACQMISEELFLKKHGFHPLQAVGMEGLFGTLLMIVIALPVVHFIPGSDLNGSYENVLDALYQIGNNPLLTVNVVLYIVSIAMFNYFGLSITRYLSAVHRTLIDSLRTTFVWIIGIILFETVGPPFGEVFDSGWGLIQIDGFALLIIGTLIYNKVVDLSFIPCCVEPLTSPLAEGSPNPAGNGDAEARLDDEESPQVDVDDQLPILPAPGDTPRRDGLQPTITV